MSLQNRNEKEIVPFLIAQSQDYQNYIIQHLVHCIIQTEETLYHKKNEMYEREEKLLISLEIEIRKNFEKKVRDWNKIFNDLKKKFSDENNTELFLDECFPDDVLFSFLKTFDEIAKQ